MALRGSALSPFGRDAEAPFAGCLQPARCATMQRVGSDALSNLSTNDWHWPGEEINVNQEVTLALRFAGDANNADYTAPKPAPPSDEWPTTLRFSRRAGEALRGLDYAQSIEPPERSAIPGRAWAWAGVCLVVTLGVVANLR
jgi:hypothetical protein